MIQSRHASSSWRRKRGARAYQASFAAIVCLVLARAELRAQGEDPPPPTEITERVATAERSEAADGPGISLLSGREIPGKVLRIDSDGLVIEGEPAPVPRFDIEEIRFSSKGAETPDLDSGPIVRFRTGETLVARVVSATPEKATIRVEGLGDIEVPLEAIGAFRLREEHTSDRSFANALDATAPSSDAVWARRGNDILRVDGIFRGLDEEYLRFERSASVGRMRRRLVHGMALAPVAASRREADPPEIFEWAGLGRMPGYLRNITADAVEIRLPGAPDSATVTLPRAKLARISFASDRIVFLSSIEPRRAEEVPVVGTPIGYAKDRSVSGGPLRLAGRTYYRGLGVRSRTTLEYALDGQYRAFAATIGIDDAAGDKGGVTFRVSADGKSLYEKDLRAGAPPEVVSLPLEGVDVLSLEVDYGPDGSDLGDHAVWGAARLTR
ncbi:MAG TPA: NPCBM/NEW2 domain-containing protein [Planctomycetota bacterium]|nr:NPCBM/NEW2 domain-containing protein [Planctomycetota bacterium]